MDDIHANQQPPPLHLVRAHEDAPPWQADPRPTLWQLLRIWIAIGLASFGGGSSTLLLIQREFTEKHRWLTMEEFTRYWNLCIMTPGINLVAVTVLIGRKLGGVGGVLLSLAGLLVPSATITCLIAAAFKEIEHQAFIQAMLQGVVPATAGVMLLVAVNFARPLLRRGYQEGLPLLALSLAFMVLVALALIVFKISVALVVIAAALAGRLLFVHAPAEAAPATEGAGRDAEEVP